MTGTRKGVMAGFISGFIFSELLEMPITVLAMLNRFQVKQNGRLTYVDIAVSEHLPWDVRR